MTQMNIPFKMQMLHSDMSAPYTMNKQNLLLLLVK